MTQEIVERTPYDDIPYESNPFPQTHPQRLASVAKLFGLSTPPIEKCRVLELGCASGGNIIPMAYNLPEAEFVGVDLAAEQVKVAHKTIADLGLKNIRIENASILDVDDSWGKFDYVISHGVFSWVPPEVQDKMLAISSENLVDDGVAYISYNVYPGWHMRGMVRHMMMYHTAQFNDQKRKIQQARALIDFLAKSVPTENNYFGLLLKSEMELTQKSKDYYLFHEHLENENIPMYFHQFAEMAEKHNLQYLGESEFSTMLTSGFPKEVAETLKRISRNIVQTEQYMDFVRNRMFRQTLLCHQGQAINRNITPKNLMEFKFSSAAAPEEKDVDMSAEKKYSFKSPKGPSITTNRPLTKAALIALKEVWPKALTMNELAQKCTARIKDAGFPDQIGNEEQVKQVLAMDILQCLTVNLVEYSTWQADFTMEISDKPKASPVAIAQAKTAPRSVNQRHESIPLDAALRSLLPLLDGSRNKEALLKEMTALVKNGALSLRQQDKLVTEEELIASSLSKIIDNGLNYLAKNAVLIA